MDSDKTSFTGLPPTVIEYIDAVIKKMRYRKKIRADVRTELTAHFEDALRDCDSDDEKAKLTADMIAKFGEPKLLAKLIRRSKKRCRPLWQKTLIRCGQFVMILLLLIGLRVAHLGLGRPTISVDYVQWLNELVSQERDEELNAAIYWKQALEILLESDTSSIADFYDVMLRKHDQLSEEEQVIAKQLLAEHAETLNLLRKGAEKPYYWFEYKREVVPDLKTGILIRRMDAELLAHLLPELGVYKKAMRLLMLSSYCKISEGNIAGGISDLMVTWRMGESLTGRGLIIEQLVGISLEAIAYSGFKYVLKRYEVPAQLLGQIQERIEDGVNYEKPPFGFEAEKAFWYEMVQYGFTDDENGNGRVLKNGLPLVISTWQRSLADFVLLDFPDRKEVTAEIDRYYNTVKVLTEKTPRQLRNEGWDDNKWQQISGDMWFLNTLEGAYQKVSELGWRSRTEQRATVTIMAILRFKKVTGGYPESLADLVAGGFLKQLPMDPFSDGPLIYRIMDDGFMLYSAGLNMIDDGGEYGTTSKGKKKQWGENGDRIFWPVERSGD